MNNEYNLRHVLGLGMKVEEPTAYKGTKLGKEAMQFGLNEV